MSTVNSKEGKLIFRGLVLHYTNKKPVSIKNVLEWKWENGFIKGKQTGDLFFECEDSDLTHVRETKEIVYKDNGVR